MKVWFQAVGMIAILLSYGYVASMAGHDHSTHGKNVSSESHQEHSSELEDDSHSHSH